MGRKRICGGTKTLVAVDVGGIWLRYSCGMDFCRNRINNLQYSKLFRALTGGDVKAPKKKIQKNFLPL